MFSCPYCGDRKTALTVSAPDCFFVECHNCEMRGPKAFNKEIAINRWNQLSNLYAALERQAWNLAGCECVVLGQAQPEDYENNEYILPALRAVIDYVKKHNEMVQAVKDVLPGTYDLVLGIPHDNQMVEDAKRQADSKYPTPKEADENRLS